VSDKDNSLMNNSLFQDSINLKEENDSFLTNRSINYKDKEHVGKSNNVTSLSLSKSNFNLDTNRSNYLMSQTDKNNH